MPRPLILVALGLTLAATGCGGAGGGRPARAAGTTGVQDVAVPPPRATDLGAAALAAGCVVREFQSEGYEHTRAAVRYRTNPPTSGNHDPEVAADGAYPSGNTQPVGRLVHALEHGRVEIQYRPGLDARRVGQLQTVFGEQGGYHALLFENATGMPYDVAVASWRRLLACPRIDDRTFDAIRAFRAAYTDKGREVVP